MKPRRIIFQATTGARRRRAGFTLIEVLAALMFMAVVIPVAIRGVQVASRAGVVGVRKMAAGRIAERVLNDIIVNQDLLGIPNNGTTSEGDNDYQWTVQTDPWVEDSLTQMRMVTVRVIFIVQGEKYEAELSTLMSLPAL